MAIPIDHILINLIDFNEKVKLIDSCSCQHDQIVVLVTVVP